MAYCGDFEHQGLWADNDKCGKPESGWGCCFGNGFGKDLTQRPLETDLKEKSGQCRIMEICVADGSYDIINGLCAEPADWDCDPGMWMQGPCNYVSPTALCCTNNSFINDPIPMLTQKTNINALKQCYPTGKTKDDGPGYCYSASKYKCGAGGETHAPGKYGCKPSESCCYGGSVLLKRIEWCLPTKLASSQTQVGNPDSPPDSALALAGDKDNPDPAAADSNGNSAVASIPAADNSAGGFF